MPEGHTIHRLAADYRERFGGRPVRADSPQGKFADGAALIDGQTLTATEAHGKHLFLGFTGGASWAHIHLGLYGKVFFGTGPAPAPVGQVRLRLRNDDGYAELRGPHTCALITPDERRAVVHRLGPDPLRADADPERAWRRISAGTSAVAALLLDQAVIAGVGNVYRAEALFRQGIDPHRPGRSLTRAEFDALWADLAALMREGVRLGRIDTVRPEHTPEAMGRPPRRDGHGGEVYVYRRTGAACHVCGGEVRTAALAARNLFWCPACQPR
ncbi:Fpg/Nei family DNA glycosylase [Streptomyces sp. NBC_01803]|uniref:Fpg/Nei family DNA glycosylase n=1 Tax=Streptomyces sp. NBC_01803 TaxID=2975946 RepID=UPI002DDC0297|nr:DNA-formamidopyrimidine glycosylase family protein [Streptomyces sp. NBC_01803]WSA46210.1 Fpg/Nei family DNA glycosylase [Streptomyces sp. NBC_01803]